MPINTTKILALIPARSGSKGVQDKNIRLLGGKPLIAHTIDAALESKYLTKIIVSTDSKKYALIAEEFGAEVPFLRPDYLSDDKAASIDVVIHALKFLEEKGQTFDAVCLLQPTSPMRPAGMIDQAILKFIESGADALISVLPVPHEFNPHWVFEPNDEYLKIATGEKEIIKRRQELPQAFIRDGSVYITKTEVLLKGSFYGDKLTYVVNNPEMSVNIDTEKDWILAENKVHLLKNQG